ncbi:hypothetical protein EAF00_009297 [Botryotinia globosa]|nr:hypothetical protein EAF00_009297 [Botryotinia globosa]
MRNKQLSSHTQNTISSELLTPRILIEFTSSSSVESQTRKKPRTKEVQITMEYSGPLAPWKIEERAKQKEELDSQKKRDPITVTVFSSRYILGYNFENPDEIPKNRLTNDLGNPSPPVIEPVVPLLNRGLSHSRKVRKKSSPPTAIGRASRCAPLKIRARSLRASWVTPKHTRLILRVQRQQERSNSIYYHVARSNLSQSNTRHSSAEKYSSKDASTQTNFSYSSAVSVLSEESD